MKKMLLAAVLVAFCLGTANAQVSYYPVGVLGTINYATFGAQTIATFNSGTGHAVLYCTVNQPTSTTAWFKLQVSKDGGPAVDVPFVLLRAGGVFKMNTIHAGNGTHVGDNYQVDLGNFYYGVSVYAVAVNQSTTAATDSCTLRIS